MRIVPKQAFPFSQGLAYHANFTMLEIPKSAMDDARCPASSPAGKISLLHQQHAPSGKRAHPCNGHAINAASDDGDFKVRASQTRAGWTRIGHARSEERRVGKEWT